MANQEYKEKVAFLESTGTQWIDTGSTINTATDTIEVVFQNNESNTYKWFLGEHDNNARFGLGSGDGEGKRNVAYGNNTYKVSDSLQYFSSHTLKADQNGIFIDGTKIANYSSFASTSTIYLFNLNLSGGNYVSKAKIWSYKQTRNGEQIRDFMPVLDNSNVPCLYDKVSKTFFYNQGTGEFGYERISSYNTDLQANNAELQEILNIVNALPAPVNLDDELETQESLIQRMATSLDLDINNEPPTGQVGLPSEYQQVKFLESSGSQYIDIGYSSGGNIKYQITASILETTSSSEYRGFFGTSVAPNARCGAGFYAGKIRVQFGAGSAVYDSNYHDCDFADFAIPTTYTLSKDGFYIGNRLEWTPKATVSASTGVTIYAFNTHAESAYTGAKLKIYSFKVWNSNTLVCDLTPCYRKSDNKAGMYDSVSKAFFTNAGPGEFTCGSVVSAHSAYNNELTRNNENLQTILDGITSIPDSDDGFVEQTGAFDILQLNPTTVIDVDCKLYFPAATYSYDDFYTNSDVLSGTLIEFSDGTKLYGKPDEGWALYLLYRGVEYEIWSSGSWTESAISAKSENTSTFVISKGSTVVVNNSGNGYAKARRFMVSNATVTVVSEVANSMFNKIPSSYTINRWDTDITYGGVSCAQIQFHTTPEIVLPYDATTENTYIYFDHTGLSMEMQLRAIRIPSTGLAGAKLSDLVFLYDDSGGYVSYGMGLDYGATQEINFALGDNNVGRHILAIHCNGKEICMSSYNQYADSHFPMNFIT